MDFFEDLEKKGKKDGIMKRIAGGIISNENNEILFLKRKSDDFMGGILELPSGNVEEKETIDQGLVREVKEETGLEINKIGIFINAFDYLSRSGKKSRQYNFEAIVKKSDNIFLTEHDEYRWLSYEEIQKSNEVTDEVKYTILIYKYNKTRGGF
jgi:8-oxo-dGTP diphosphatase